MKVEHGGGPAVVATPVVSCGPPVVTTVAPVGPVAPVDTVVHTSQLPVTESWKKVQKTQVVHVAFPLATAQYSPDAQSECPVQLVALARAAKVNTTTKGANLWEKVRSERTSE